MKRSRCYPLFPHLYNFLAGFYWLGTALWELLYNSRPNLTMVYEAQNIWNLNKIRISLITKESGLSRWQRASSTWTLSCACTPKICKVDLAILLSLHTTTDAYNLISVLLKCPEYPRNMSIMGNTRLHYLNSRQTFEKQNSICIFPNTTETITLM